jgi:hypothetical protein
VLEAHGLPVAHPERVDERRVEGCPTFRFASESPDHHHVLGRVDELLGFGPELVEVPGNGREHVVGDALGSMKSACGRAAAAWLDPFDPRVERLDYGGDVPPVERLVRASDGLHVLL